MQLIESFVRNPVKVSVGVLLVALFGFVALGGMPKQLTPEVDTPTITIETRWPGASPQEVEREIVQEQEEQLKSVEGVTKMTSESQDSMGRITLEFLVGMNMEEAQVQVMSRLQQVREYPEDADQPVLSTSNASDRPIAWFILSARQPTEEQLVAWRDKHPELSEELDEIIGTHNTGLALLRLRVLEKKYRAKYPDIQEILPPDLDVPKWRRFAEDNIEAIFERVPGVSNSNVMGGLEDELQVVVDPQKLAARGLTIENVRQVLREQNRDTSGGDLWEGKRRWVVRTLGQFKSPEQVEHQLLAYRDGAPVYIRDVAEVRMGYKKPDGVVRRFGVSNIAVNAQRETGANVLEVMDGLREKARELNEGILKRNGLQIAQVYDETEYINSAIGLVQQNIFIGGALTMIVLMLFLHLSVRTLLIVPFIAVTAVLSVLVSPWFFAASLLLVLVAGFWFARGALVVGLAIPTSIIGTFLVMGFLQRSLNVISLAGLAFAVGMLVDNAVVVLENIYRRYAMGESPFTAAVKGTQEVWGAVVASTLTTIAVFVPVLFVQEEAGQLFRDIALAISAAVGLSLIVSMTVIPAAAARLFGDRRRRRDVSGAPGELNRDQAASAPVGARPHSDGDARTILETVAADFAVEVGPRSPSDGDARAAVDENGRPGGAVPASGPPKTNERALRPTAGLFARIAAAIIWPIQMAATGSVALVVGINAWAQRGVLRRLVVAVLMVGISFSFLSIWPKAEYLPTGNRNLVFGILIPPPGYNLDQLMELGETVEADLRPYWDVDPGSPQAEQLDYPVIGDFFFVARNRQVFLGVRAHDPMRAGELVPLIQSLRSKLPGTIVVANQSSLFDRGLGASRSIDVEITGPELETLVGLGGRIMGQTMQLLPEGQARPVPSLDLSSPEVHIDPRLVNAAEMGVSATDLGYSVNALVDGAYASDYFVGGDKIDLTIVGQETLAGRTQDLAALPIATPASTQPVPLGALADVWLRSGPEQINHRERLRAITIQVTPPPAMALEDAMDVIREKIITPLQESGALDGGYRIMLAGTADKLGQTWDALWFNFALACMITYLLMAALFESWLYPLVIILTVPLGVIGGVGGLYLLNIYLGMRGQIPQQLDVLTMLGFVILIGTVVNNAILIVHQALNHMREDAMQPQQAVLESVRTRIRPIFMTTITTVLGLLPLVLFPGAGSELYRGLGSVVLGGLVVSTFFTLFLIPTVFSLFMDAKKLVAHMLGMTVQEERAALAAATAAAPSGNGDIYKFDDAADVPSKDSETVREAERAARRERSKTH